MIADMMGDGPDAQAMRLECEKAMDEASGAWKLRMAMPAGCRAGRVAVWCQDCMLAGQKVRRGSGGSAAVAAAVGCCV